MEILNNREIAIALWLFVIAIYTSTSSKMAGVRVSFKEILATFFVRQVITVLCLMIGYIAIVIYWLSELSLWNAEQLKNTVFWCASIGFMSLFKLEEIKKDKNFFKHSVIDDLKLLAILQFIIGVYTFPLWIEILLNPVLALIGIMLALAERDKKYHQVKILLEYCLSAFGAILIAFTLYMLATNFGEFGKEQTAYDFFVPPLLTLCYLPFIYFMLIFSTYQQAFIRINSSIENRFHRRIAKLYAFILFNVQLSLLDRWAHQVAREKIESHADLVETFKYIFKVRTSEKKLKEVPSDQGWCPYKAKDYLLNKGFNTGFYDRFFEDEWSASSSLKEFSDGVFPDNIAYYVEGSEEFATVLKLKVNVNDAVRSRQALEKLMEIAEALSISSLSQPLSGKMRNAVSQCEPYFETYEGKTISFAIEKWLGHEFDGYDLKFVISNN